MITQKELHKRMIRSELRATQIEKDYVLTWLLTGIAFDEVLKNFLIFKGGTCLKKIYFEDYRFSEDLDFTVLKNSEISVKDLQERFSRIFFFVCNQSLNQLSIVGDIEMNSSWTINFDIGYVSVLGGSGSNKNIKVDISMDELVINQPIQKDLLQTYSDQLDCNLYCYPLEEVLTEKMRAVLQRTRPRDLFDLWYLLEIHEMNIYENYSDFVEKAKYKNLDSSDFLTKVEEKFLSFRKQWDASMQHQIKDLPKFEDVVRGLGKHFRFLQKKQIQL
jgi:predicted nucleotidyltransferase component of viral defense system